MKKYVCTVCGYVYDEEKGIPEAGIAPGTRWEELPENWVCPLCGASKSEFRAQEDEAKPRLSADSVTASASADMRELTPLETSALCSNLARGCEKQYKAREAELFTKLAQCFRESEPPRHEADMAELLALVEKDLSDAIPAAKSAAGAEGDRGALRALTWCEKVTRILRSLLQRYETEGEAMLENTGVYVCTICGFIYIGDNPPELCPVCKVPSWKFEKM